MDSVPPFSIQRAEEIFFVSQDSLVLQLNFHCVILSTDRANSAAINR